MKTIKLTKGKFALVDDEDYERLNKFNWQAQKARQTYYARRTVWRNGKTAEKIYMHREIMKAPKGIEVDHEDGDGLNCQKYNMRLCTSGQNSMNQKKRTAKCHSRFIGVSLDKRRGTWQAYININGKRTYIGAYNDEVEAAKARDAKAIELFGEFARINEYNKVAQAA